MRVRVNFGLVQQALFVIVKKFDGVLDGDHVLFTFAVDLVEHGRERSRLPGARWSGHEDESAGLVAQSLHDQGQYESVEALAFPRNSTEDGADRSPLIENVAAEAGQVFQTEGEVQLQVLFEAVFLRIRQNAISKRLGIRRSQRRHVKRAEPPVHPYARRAIRGDVEVAASHLDHLLQQFTESNSSHRSPSML